MKKVLIYGFLMGALASCSRDLSDHPKGILAGNVINSIATLQTAVSGAYQPLQNGYTSGVGSSAIVAVLMGSEDLTTHPLSNKQELRQMDQFDVSNTNSRVLAIWLGFYKSIQNANNIIANYKNIPGTSTEQTQINQLAGEAYFLRAFDYFWLTRLFGNIPLVTTAQYSTDLAKVQKSTPADVYKLIESDLQQAETMLPAKKAAPGRVGIGGAKALLAQVYLTEGGYPINDASKYVLAASKAQEVIKDSTTYGFGLSDLATIWSGLTSSMNLPEDVFSLQFCASCGVANSVYGKSGMPGDEGGWDDYFCEINFYKNFPAGKRKQITFEDTLTTSKGVKLYWANDATGHPYYKKFRINTPTANLLTSATDQSIRLIRYADVLLTFAEAQARSAGTPSADAYTAVNAVRERAGEADLQAGLSSAAFADSVVNERAWEFAGEYTRWFDLVRLQEVAAANANKDPKENQPVNQPATDRYWLPIPSVDVTLNSNLNN